MTNIEYLMAIEYEKRDKSENYDQYKMHEVVIRMLKSLELTRDKWEYLERKQDRAIEVAKAYEGKDNERYATAMYLIAIIERAQECLDKDERA